MIFKARNFIASGLYFFTQGIFKSKCLVRSTYDFLMSGERYKASLVLEQPITGE
jgi:hypothetical protein